MLCVPKVEFCFTCKMTKKIYTNPIVESSAATLEFLINMSTQISMSSGKKIKKLISMLVPNKHVQWKKPKVYRYEFGTNTLIDSLNTCAISIHIHEKTKLTGLKKFILVIITFSDKISFFRGLGMGRHSGVPNKHVYPNKHVQWEEN